MSADYVPQVGDRVVADGEFGFVLAVDGPDAWIKWDDDGRSTEKASVLAKAPLPPPLTLGDFWVVEYVTNRDPFGGPSSGQLTLLTQGKPYGDFNEFIGATVRLVKA